MKFLFGTLVVVFLAYQGLKVGAVWDSHVNPVENAMVSIKGHESIDAFEVIKGSLSRNFDGSVNIKTKEGGVVTIPEHSIGGIGYPSDQSNRMHWRFWLPSFLIMMCYSVVLARAVPVVVR